MKFKGIKYRQQQQEYISTVLPLKVVYGIAEPLIYGKDKYGYQRELDKKHYTKISKDVKNNHATLPTSIILGINESQLKKYLMGENNNSDQIVELDFEQVNSKEFRIVDGQHRIEALRLLAESSEEFLDYELSVIILITNEDKRVLEVTIFKDINSKGKKITTDLTLLAQYNYELLGEKEITEENIVAHIGVKVAYILNEKKEKSKWRQAIKLDIHTKDIKGIIGISAFNNSIKSITKYFVDNQGILGKIEKEPNERIRIAENVANEISDVLHESWEIVYEKWGECFNQEKFSETVYDKGYYLQKTTGINAIHMILLECIQESPAISSRGIIERFYERINKSTLKSDDWKIGGRFVGLTSQSGFNKAKSYILGE